MNIDNIPDQGRELEWRGLTGQSRSERRERMDAVINIRNEPGLREKFEYAPVHNSTLLIDRRTKWGNKFRIGPDGTREEVVARYRADLWQRIRAGAITLQELAVMDGMCLACWCDPLPCHGHVLARAAAWAASTLAKPRGE